MRSSALTPPGLGPLTSLFEKKTKGDLLACCMQSLNEMRKSYDIGREVEQQAVQWFLKERQGRVLVQNYRCPAGEIDFIFEEELPSLEQDSISNVQRLELVFVEVRARTPGRSWLDPLASISPKKRLCLKRAAEHYLAKYKGHATSLRFDLLSWDMQSWEHRPDIQIGVEL